MSIGLVKALIFFILGSPRAPKRRAAARAAGNMVAAPWYETVALLASHLTVVPAIVLGILGRFSLASGILILTAFTSTFYHGCMAVDMCPFDASVATWRTIDWQTACGNILAAASVLVSMEATRQQPLVVAAAPIGTDADARRTARANKRQAFWAHTSGIIAFGLIVALVTVSMQTPSAFGAGTMYFEFAVAAVVVVYVFLNVVLVADNLLFLYQYDWRYILGALVAYAAGIAGFFIDVAGAYWALHSAWHLLSFLGTTLLIRGASAVKYNKRGQYKDT